MAAPSNAAVVSFASVWLHRLRFAVAVGLLWGGLHYVVGPLLPRGLDRPVMILSSFSGMGTALLAALLLWVGGGLAAWLVRDEDGQRTLAAVGLALALWATEGGTMDEWLRLCNTVPDQARQSASSAYLGLLGDHVFFLIVVGGVVAIGALAPLGGKLLNAEARRARLNQAFNLANLRRAWPTGLTALAITLSVAGVGMLVLTGPRVAQTWRGQVYFAVAVSFIAGVFAAHQMTKVRNPLWYWPAPILLGLIGALRAGLKPDLPGGYAHLNIIPAHGWVRPLPVELVGVGLVAMVWMLRAIAHSSAPAPAPAGGSGS